MSSFLIENYMTIYRGSEILSVLAGVFCYKKFKSKSARIFIWFLVYVQFLEIIGDYPRKVKKIDSLTWVGELIENTLFANNYWYFNVFWSVVVSAIIAYYFYLVTTDKILKKVIKLGTICFLLASVIILLLDYETLYYNLIFSIEVLSLALILLVIFSYFTELLYSDKILKFYRSLSFYIAVGVLVFWILTTPMDFYEQYYNTSDTAFILLKRYVYLFSIVFMYLTFSFGFIVSNPEK